jgi:hypothetical protein
MQDQLGQIYLESVASPEKAGKVDRHDKKPNTTVKEGDDFGFQKKGIQKGTGPEARKKDLKKVKEDTDMNETETPIIGSQFDSLFSKTIKEDFEPADDSGEFGAPAGDMEFDAGEEGDDFGGDEEEPETDLRSAISNIIDQLQDILSNVEGGEGEDEFGGVEAGEDEFGDEGGDIEDLETASTHVYKRPIDEDAKMGAMTRTRDGKLSSATDSKARMQSKSNKVGGTHYGRKTHGTANTSANDSKPRDGRLRSGPNYKSLQGKDNKVHQPGTAGSKPGTSLFG